MIKDIIERLVGQFVNKNNAYGGSAHTTFLEFGSASYAIRLHDKLRRYEQLIQNPDLPHGDEAIEDTLGDAVTYAAMFSADLKLKMMPGTGVHFNETIDLLHLLGASEEKDVLSMANTFEKEIMMDNSLPGTIVRMWNYSATPSEYVLLAAYLLNLLNERVNNIDD